METYMTAKEVAEKVRLSEQTIRRYVMNGEIPFHKVFRAVRFRPSEIEAWFENKKRTSSAEGREIGEGGLFDERPAAGTPEAGGEA